MGWPKRLILLRHGKSEVNLRGRDENALLDTADNAFPLVEKGKQQSVFTQRYIETEFPDVDVVLSSHYERTMQTARIIFPGKHIIEEPRLAEMRIGMWTMFTGAQITALMPREIARFDAEGLYNYKPFGGENGPDVEMRIHSLRTTLREECEGAVVALVTHHQWLVLWQRINDGIPIEEAADRMRAGFFNNASVTVYEPGLVNNRVELIPKMVNHVPWKGGPKSDR